MSSSAIALVLCAALAHAAWNVLAHGLSRAGLPFLWWGAVLSTVLWVPVIPLTGGVGEDLAGAGLGVLVSGLLHVAYMSVLQRGYARGNLSTVYATARGTGPVLSIVAAVVLLGERPPPLALVGVAAILGGVVVVARADHRPDAGLEPRSTTRLDPGIAYGLLTGVAIATYTSWDAFAVRSWAISPVAFMAGCTLVEIPIYSLALGRRHAELGAFFRTRWGALITFGCCPHSRTSSSSRPSPWPRSPWWHPPGKSASSWSASSALDSSRKGAVPCGCSARASSS